MPPEEDRAMAIGNVHKNFRESQACTVVPKMIVDRQTHAHTDMLITILPLKNIFVSDVSASPGPLKSIGNNQLVVDILNHIH